MLSNRHGSKFISKSGTSVELTRKGHVRFLQVKVRERGVKPQFIAPVESIPTSGAVGSKDFKMDGVAAAHRDNEELLFGTRGVSASSTDVSRPSAVAVPCSLGAPGAGTSGVAVCDGANLGADHRQPGGAE